jgi:chromosome partitioning protein
MRRIALVNQKGGVGKTTTSVNLAAGLALLGHRVLLMDMEPQANATISFGLLPHKLKHTTYTLLAGRSVAEKAIARVRDNLWLLPANVDLAAAETELANEIGRETLLRERLAAAADFEFAVIDSPPSLGVLNINSLCCAEEVFIPVQCEFFALNGISLLTRTIELVRRRLNPSLQVTGIVACMYNGRKALTREALADIEKHFGARVFATRIRINVKLAEAPSYGKTIFEYAPDSNGAADYLGLAKEVAAMRAQEASPARPLQPVEQGV